VASPSFAPRWPVVSLSGMSPVKARGETDPLHPGGTHQPVGEAWDAVEQCGSKLAWKQERRWGKSGKGGDRWCYL
jgi:hypothetical protein